MDIFVNIVIFLTAFAVVWIFAGMLIDSVHRIARRYCRTGFFTAFFILGFLTSVSEFSVAINSGLAGVPEVSTGNLIGATFVILLFIVPLLAVANRGIPLNGAVTDKTLFLMLFAIALPALLVVDGNVTRAEGLIAILMYATVAFVLYHQRDAINACDPVEQEQARRERPLWQDLVRIAIGGAAIFGAAYFLVEQAVFFAGVLSVPASLIGLILLSIGTNVPEIVIAVRAMLKKHADIAFGDYLGSAAMNALIFGGLAVTTGPFRIEPSEFIMTSALLVVGFICMNIFARSGRLISRREGMILLAFYAAFLIIQFYNVVRFATD